MKPAPRHLAGRLAAPALAMLCLPAGPLTAQTSAPGPAAKAVPSPVKRSSSASVSYKKGEIGEIDAAAGTMTLKNAAGQTTAYALTEKTRCLRKRREARVDDFKPGDRVVLHVRKSRTVVTPIVIELLDPESDQWQRSLRGRLISGTIAEIDEESLVLSVGADKIPFTVGAKARWVKSGKEASAADFKVGDSVVVSPRTLASGGFGAAVISDNKAGAIQGKERAARTVHGTIASIDAAAHTITLNTTAGDSRTFAFTASTAVGSTKRPLIPASLKVGQAVTVRFRQDEEGKETAWRISLQTPQRKSAGTAK